MVTPELLGAVRRHPLWRLASEQGARQLCAASNDARFQPGDSILTAGTEAKHVFLLLEGAARVFYPATDETAEITAKLFWGPAAFGEAEAVMRYTWAETVQALTPARVLITEAGQYFRLLQSEPKVCFRSYWDVAGRFAIAIRAMKSASLDDLEERVIALLVSYVNHFGVEHAQGKLIDFALTQDDIARQVGSNRRSIVRMLGRLYKAGLVRRAGRKFLVTDTEALLARTKLALPDISYSVEDRPWAEVVR